MSTAPSKKFSEQRAGIIPYIWNSKKNAYDYLFMFPSDAKYGGPHIQIAKGRVDPGENVFSSAIREGTEELGLVHANMASQPWKIIKELTITKLDQYYLTVYAVEVKDKKNFEKPHFETKFTTWVTCDRFQQIGRKTHKRIVTKLEEILASKTPEIKEAIGFRKFFNSSLILQNTL